MRRQLRRRSVGCPVSAETICLAVLGICFCLSGAAGCFFASGSADNNAATLSGAVKQYVQQFSSDLLIVPGFIPVLFEFLLVPAVLFVGGFSPLGMVLIPLITCVRAFTLSYAITVFVRAFGVFGLAASGGAFLLHALASVPALFTVGSIALSASVCRVSSGKEASALLSEHILSSLVCAALIIPAALLQWSVMPRLFGAAAEILAKTI